MSRHPQLCREFRLSRVDPVGRVLATHMRRLVPLALTSALAALALALPGTASATSVAGPNGKIVFASGRANSDVPAPPANNDDNARLWVVDPGGTPVQVTSHPSGVQDRHPNWSPDHTKIVYAEGP